MGAVSVVGLVLAAVALAGLAAVVGRPNRLELQSSVEPDVEAEYSTPGVWEQPSWCEHPGLAISETSVRCVDCGTVLWPAPSTVRSTR